MSDKTRLAQIAHVLFLDMVGYTRETTTTTQSRMVATLNRIVEASRAFADARSQEKVQPIPTGDGMALLFFDAVIAPAQCAVEISHNLRGESLALRMGIHSGLIQKQLDIAGNENVVGEGINTANRVMDFGDAGHILMSAQYANWLQQFDDWKPFVHPLGEGAAKHDQIVSVYNLYSSDFGRRDLPAKLKTSAKARGGAEEKSVSGVTSQKIALLYKPNQEPDQRVLQTLQQHLQAHGHTVFVDNQAKINANWAKAVEEPIRQADAVIAIVSPKSLQSEMLEFEIETAHDQFVKTGKPMLLPVRIGPDEIEDGIIASLIQPLTQFLWKSEEDEQQLVVELLSAIQEPLKPRATEVKLEPVGGAVPPDSPFYVKRTCDTEFATALRNNESILLVKGARQMGKTSLLGQGTRQAKEAGWRIGLTDFQKLNAAQIASEETFYRLLAATLARQMKFAYDFQNEWLDLFGSNMNMENFLRELLDASETPLVWFMDEADKLFSAPFASDFFGLVRSWHNARSTEPDGPWNKLTVVIAYATEAHLFIQDLNQSPFNVGRRIELDDFNVQQVVDLNGRYGSSLSSYAQIERLHELIGGQPFLTRRALDALATGKYNFDGLLARSGRDDGPFGDHLMRLLVGVSRLPEVADYVRALLAGSAAKDQTAYYRLLSSGVIRQTPEGAVTFRCELYERYLRQHLA